MKQNPRVVLALATVLLTLLGALGLGIAHALTSGTPDVRIASSRAATAASRSRSNSASTTANGARAFCRPAASCAPTPSR